MQTLFDIITAIVGGCVGCIIVYAVFHELRGAEPPTGGKDSK